MKKNNYKEKYEKQLEEYEKCNNEREKLKKKNKHKTLIIFILIIIIIFLLLHSCSSKKTGKTPTNNSDTFEINCNCDNDPIQENNEEQIKNEKGNETGELVVFDDDFTWTASNKLRIFENPMYDMEEIIAPGSRNSYHFYVKNNKNCTVNYKINFAENNPHNVNMKYKLKRNGEDIINHWVSYDELVTKTYQLISQKQDEYTLEWQWAHSDSKDTIAGKTINAEYELKIVVYGEQDS